MKQLLWVIATMIVKLCASETCKFRTVPESEAINCTQLPGRLPPETSQYGRVARKMCRKHQEDFCSMPARSEGRACPSSGVNADILEFPHMALLGYGDGADREYSCGGSLISPTFVLTAAHCSTALNDKPMRTVVLGATNRTDSGQSDGGTRQEIPVAEVISHPGFRPPQKYNDIALVRLQRPAKLDRLNVRPACLHTDVDPLPLGEEAIATGWGATGWAEEASESLVKVNLTLRGLSFCADSMQLDGAQTPRGLLGDTQLCAGGGSHGRDTCQGDSGGPLQLRADPNNFYTCLYRIVGVVSFGPFCGLGKPGVYSRVSGFVPWIESIVWPSESGQCARGTPYRDGEPYNMTVEVPNTGPGTVARRMCRTYHLDFCPNFPYSRVVTPGITTKTRCHHNRPKREEAPWQPTSTGTLRYGDGIYNREFACTGVLISPEYVLTAAHCLTLGCLPVTDVVFSHPGSCDGKFNFEVDSVVKHPAAETGHRYDSLGLIKLKRKVDVLDFMPACLHTDRDEKLDGKDLTAEGYAAEGSWEHTSYRPYAKQLQVRRWGSCQSLLAGVGAPLADGLRSSQFCAGAGELGICLNYSYPGHPGAAMQRAPYSLIHPENSNIVKPVPELIGVEAFSSACGAGKPDVFTSVAQYIPWIESTVWPDEA